MVIKDVERFNNVKDLLGNKDKAVLDKINEKSNELGGLTKEERSAMGFFKFARNRGVHKGTTLPRKMALERLNLASTNISPICESGLKKCIEFMNK
ncbi:hypothetical protein GLOIN_2v1733770 [Rhizophagus clarus]|uniref:Uncharacterized protein n=1 Tax=Rhizophagus clarus TaxID=94130 RepID=A0A8H3LP04_9GLOM|nr:hypothetical protein GLOIN_2v1733770 [Rhizophagus clarus]